MGVSVKFRVSEDLRLCSKSERFSETSWRFEKLEADARSGERRWRAQTDWMSAAAALSRLEELQIPGPVVGRFAGFTLLYPPPAAEAGAGASVGNDC
jgi:hypothetical protein